MSGFKPAHGRIRYLPYTKRLEERLQFCRIVCDNSVVKSERQAAIVSGQVHLRYMVRSVIRRSEWH
jgi:hypothetical protein